MEKELMEKRLKEIREMIAKEKRPITTFPSVRGYKCFIGELVKIPPRYNRFKKNLKQ